jgi:large subunit ribosomal protein L35
LISHNSKYIRQNRGTETMSDADAKKIKSYMPYA